MNRIPHATLRPTVLACALLAAGTAPIAFAQPAESAPAGDGLRLDQVVVTGTAAPGTSKMRASVSVSTLDAEQVQATGAASAAELLRSVPGVRAESSGGESNANVTVRGVPISAGGSRYVQFQEDGLPVLQFGDLNFATPDTFLRADHTLDSLQVVRGGSASTLATNGPGGILNFVSKTGEERGGTAAVTLGVGRYDQRRFELGYGGPIDDATRFYIGGHWRQGNGLRDAGVRTEEGGQIKANITRDLGGGSYLRASFKHLDDRSPTLLPVPVRFVNGGIQTVPGIDPRTASLYTPYWVPDSTLRPDNTRRATDVNDGLSAQSTAFGLEGKFNLADWTLENRFRHSRNRGRFTGVFPGTDVAATPAGTRYATGPLAGQPYAGGAFTAVVFNTSFDDLDLTANELKLSRAFTGVGGGTLTPLFGLYASRQKVGMTWNFNQYAMEATGDRPALLNQPGVVNGSAGFGGCCMNTIAAGYTTVAPFASVAWERGPVNLDASVRHDRQRASGRYNQTLFATPGAAYDPAAARRIDYDTSNTAFSFGGNYRFDANLSVFARYSEGASFNGDRLAFFAPAAQVDGSVEVPKNEVRQAEAGVKWRAGDVSLFATAFLAKTRESNTDFTASPIRTVTNRYDSRGLELEGAWSLGDFNLRGGITLTDAEVTESTTAALVGRAPRRQARVLYQLTPTYTRGPFAAGLHIVGTSSSRDDSPAGPISVKLPAYAVANAFVSYEFLPKATIALGINNLFDKLAYTETNDGRGAARALNGRQAKLTLAYAF